MSGMGGNRNEESEGTMGGDRGTPTPSPPQQDSREPDEGARGPSPRGGRDPDEDSGHPELDEIVRQVAQAPWRSIQREPAPGTRWGTNGRYVIVRRLGAGGMGTVYEATDELLGKSVALKVLDADDEGAHRKRILLEARMAARVEHERIARVYDVGEHEGFLLMAMEFVRGGTLRRMMGWPMRVHDAMRI